MKANEPESATASAIAQRWAERLNAELDATDLRFVLVIARRETVGATIGIAGNSTTRLSIALLKSAHDYMATGKPPTASDN